MKTIDLHIRPIHHHLERRVRAHIFLCMLAYYVEWHMREAWRELMFADEDLERSYCNPSPCSRTLDSPNCCNSLILHGIQVTRTKNSCLNSATQSLRKARKDYHSCATLW
jgi:hypothetical protein